MAWARISGDSDVYVYSDVDGGYTCCMCILRNLKCAHFNYWLCMILHIAVHKFVAGHKVESDIWREAWKQR